MKFNHRAKTASKALGISDKRLDVLQEKFNALIRQEKKPISTSRVLEICHAVSENQAELVFVAFMTGERCAREELRSAAMEEMETIVASMCYGKKPKGKK